VVFVEVFDNYYLIGRISRINRIQKGGISPKYVTIGSKESSKNNLLDFWYPAMVSTNHGYKTKNN
jgi:hypothetical protein